MANIKIFDIPAGSDLFSDSESFLTDLTDYDLTSVVAGARPNTRIVASVIVTVAITIAISGPSVALITAV
ncbi:MULTISPECIES: hypothetical protein [unclassified Nostoc]|uniref:hypothetical protein n=1 Tax=unclassified Nostoc TaxID=2593658 RepID=UPI001E15E3FA|nr:hypothetical protein [Nostoc sp. JL23]MBN3878890.1 hypothetical protein [Nostoc sp. JL23]